MMYPEEYKYTQEHEWIDVTGEQARVGITDYAQRQLGDVVFVELPEVGRRLRKGESFGTIESVKAVSELFAPATGDVVEVNSSLTHSPEEINTDPHQKGWMIVLRLADASELESLLNAQAYSELTK